MDAMASNRIGCRPAPASRQIRQYTSDTNGKPVAALAAPHGSAHEPGTLTTLPSCYRAASPGSAEDCGFGIRDTQKKTPASFRMPAFFKPTLSGLTPASD
jgi:hypothetical protein